MTVKTIKAHSFVATHLSPDNLPDHPEGAVWPTEIGHVAGNASLKAAGYWDGQVFSASSYAKIDRRLTAEVIALYRHV